MGATFHTFGYQLDVLIGPDYPRLLVISKTWSFLSSRNWRFPVRTHIPGKLTLDRMEGPSRRTLIRTSPVVNALGRRKLPCAWQTAQRLEMQGKMTYSYGAESIYFIRSLVQDATKPSNIPGGARKEA